VMNTIVMHFFLFNVCLLFCVLVVIYSLISIASCLHVAVSSQATATQGVFPFLSFVSILTRDIDIGILSVCPSRSSIG